MTYAKVYVGNLKFCRDGWILPKYMQDFAKIAFSLSKLSRNDVEYVWKEECDKVFEKLKWRLTMTPILVIPTTLER